MSTDFDARNRLVLDWLREDAHENPERVLLLAIDEIEFTRQRRSWWPVRRIAHVNRYAQAAIAATAVLVVAVLGYNLLPGAGDFGGRQSPAPTALETAIPSPSPAVTPGLQTVTLRPFIGDDPEDDSFEFTAELPEGWEYSEGFLVRTAIGLNPPGGAGLLIARGGDLYSDPCRDEDEEAAEEPADIPVGPSVAEFAEALDTHPLLDVTTPVDVTLAGYEGKYLVLQLPADISRCARYRPLGGDTIYAQGPAQRFHFTILDVDGMRVVIEAFDYADTPAGQQAELRAIVDSIEINPPVVP
jgi:hypothetical protein